LDGTGKNMTGTFEFIEGSCSSTSGDNENGTFDIDFTGNVPAGDTGT
jgi:hypothetical protein